VSLAAQTAALADSLFNKFKGTAAESQVFRR